MAMSPPPSNDTRMSYVAGHHNHFPMAISVLSCFYECYECFENVDNQGRSNGEPPTLRASLSLFDPSTSELLGTSDIFVGDTTCRKSKTRYINIVQDERRSQGCADGQHSY